MEVEKTLSKIQAIQSFLDFIQADAFFVSSFDDYLSEYVPLEDSHRYQASGFTGSSGHLLIPRVGKAILFTDGRYTIQAKQEVDKKYVQIEIAKDQSLDSAAMEYLEAKKKSIIALEGNRVSYQFVRELKDHQFRVLSFNKGELAPYFSAHSYSPKIKSWALGPDISGRLTRDKIKDLRLEKKQAFFISATDQVSWLVNARSLGQPYQLSLRAKALILGREIHLFGLEKMDQIQNLDPAFKWHFHLNTDKDLINILSKIKPKIIKCDFSTLTFADYKLLKKNKAKIIDTQGHIVDLMSKKNEIELEGFRNSFKLADRAIFETIFQCKKTFKAKGQFSELDLFNLCAQNYRKQGAICHSFRTIAGVDGNGAIIHYGKSSDDNKAKDGSVFLMDSGGYFDAGLATDCTRTFCVGDPKAVNPLMKETYTLVLKGLLALQNSVFKEGTLGNALDHITRAPLLRAGYDYAHGTGHGVGIHVHEGGIRIHSSSRIEMREGRVVSLEPGIYLDQIGGVRLENIAIVKRHPMFSDCLYFEPLNYISFDKDLILFDQLNDDEKAWLDDYEKKCQERGTSLK